MFDRFSDRARRAMARSRVSYFHVALVANAGEEAKTVADVYFGSGETLLKESPR